MQLRRLRLNNFRNHSSSEILCAPRFNVLVGGNGQGKTSVLEAIAVCAWTRSFVPAPGNADAQLLRRSADGYLVDGEFDADTGAHFRVAAEYLTGREKKIAVDGQPLGSFARHIGTVPIVVLAPDARSITFGPPAERRQMIDVLISQARRGYVEAMLEFRRALRQRNLVITDVRRGTSGARQQLAAWTASITQSAAQVFHYRATFLRDFAAYVREAHQRIAVHNEDVSVTYEPNVPGTAGMGLEAWTAAVDEAFAARADDEVARGTTLVGPHRDEIRLALNDVEARLGASQGQHKTLLVALKLAEWHYLFDTLQERPIFLLDDLFSELDALRSQRFVDAIKDCGQVFISTVDGGDNLVVRGIFDPAIDRVFTVDAGTVTHV